MNTIQPIETKYKGYRFRSRLEARWAMFYDAIGVQWTYEPQPVRVDGVAYLPDFEVMLGGKLYRHEVKPAHEFDRIVPPKVYLAGHLLESGDFINSVPTPHNASLICTHIPKLERLEFQANICVFLAYLGAFPNRLFSLTIDINSANSFPEILYEADTWSELSNIDWFEQTKNDHDALSFHQRFVGRNTPEEYKKISAIGRATNAAFITFGDPLEIIENGSMHSWGDDNYFVEVFCNRSEAEAIRAHRFDSF